MGYHQSNGMRRASLLGLGLGLVVAGCDATGPSLHQGSISLYASNIGASRSMSSARFLKFQKLATCTETRFDACVATRCSGAAVPEVIKSATHTGTITIRGGRRAVVMTPAAGAGAYSNQSDDGELAPLFPAGSLLEVSSRGLPNSVPALGGGVIMPDKVEITFPSFSTNATLPVKRTQALEIHWTGGTVGTVEITLKPLGATSSGSEAVVTCSFPAVGGLGIISKDALATLGGRQGTLSIDVVNQVTQHYDDWDVTLRAATVGLQEGRQVAGGNPIDPLSLVSWTYTLTL